MKNHQKKPLFLILFGLLLNIYTVYSQTSTDNSLYKWFDKSVGQENLELYNGPRHVNIYRTLDKSHSYYFSNSYIKGNVNYQGQDYYNLDLKYDVNNDIIVLKGNGEYDYLGINLIKEKTAYFTINNRKFINVNFNASTFPEYMNGYYQETIFSKNIILYIKYHKSRGKIIDTKNNSDGTLQNSFDQFTEKNAFFLKYKNAFYKISSKSDILKIFPEQKSEIRKYYNSYSQLEESDQIVFIENLINEINNLIPNEVN